MSKKIELIPVTDPQSLKEELEEMINEGWGIKGFVCLNSGTSSCESFAVLESLSSPEKGKAPPYEYEEHGYTNKPNTKPLKQKDVSISIGGN